MGETFPVRYDLAVYRGAPWRFALGIRGYDLTGAALKMQVRSYPDAPDPALLTLNKVTTLVQGLFLDIAAGTPVTSTIVLSIDEATITDLLPFPSNGAEPGEPVVLAYDLLVTPAGGLKTRWFEGAFSIFPGVTK